MEIVIQLAGLVLGEQEMSLDDQHPYPLLTEIVTELAEMILADSEHSLSDKRSPFSVNQEAILIGFERVQHLLSDTLQSGIGCQQLRLNQ